jgi:aminoglycoside phosphotransferase (APT) family kinase protein
VAQAALRPRKPVFMHGDLQITHVFVDDDEITGVIDWSEAAQGDALYDLAANPPARSTANPLKSSNDRHESARGSSSGQSRDHVPAHRSRIWG